MVNANAAAPRGTSILMKACGICGVNKKDCKSSHSDTKPLNGGKPAMESVQMSARLAAQGMRRIKPPSFPRLRVFVACKTEPVTRKSKLLKDGWLSAWISAALRARAANRWRLLVSNRIDRP